MKDIAREVPDAVLAVESAGQGLRDGRPVVRLEIRLLWRHWGRDHPDVFDQSFKFRRDAKPWTRHRWRPGKGNWRKFHGSQAKEWEVIEYACSLDVEVAGAVWCSTSMGAAQLLGMHHERLGYQSAGDMAKAFQDEEEQELAFIRFLETDAYLVNALRREDWRSFARRYNGPGNVADYAPKLEAAVARLRAR